MNILEELRKRFEHEAAIYGVNEDVRGREVVWRMITILDEVAKDCEK